MSVRFRLSALIIVGALAAGARPARVHGAGQATSIVPSPQGPQARDAQTKLAVGSASISGVVVDAGDPTVPIRRAIVTAAGAALGEARSTVTDDNGAFALDHLPAGSFTVTASKAAYLAASFGAKRPVHAGTPMAVAAGQRVTGLSLQMSKGGVISGVIHDGDGNAVPGVQVLAMRTGEPPPLLGLPGLGQQVGSLTDDRGACGSTELSPGTYSVVAVIYVVAPGGDASAGGRGKSTAALSRSARERAARSATPPTMPPPTIYAVGRAGLLPRDGVRIAGRDGRCPCRRYP